MTVHRLDRYHAGLGAGRHAIAYTSYRSGYPDIIVQSMTIGRTARSRRRATKKCRTTCRPGRPTDQARVHVEPRRQPGDLLRQPRRQRPASGHQQPLDRRDADLVADRQSARIRVRSHRQPADLHRQHRRHRAEADHQRDACDRPTWSPAPFNEIAYASQVGRRQRHQDLRVCDRCRPGRLPTASAATRVRRSRPTAVTSRSRPTAPGSEQIYTIDRDGKNLRQITKQGRNRYPNWSQ